MIKKDVTWKVPIYHTNIHLISKKLKVLKPFQFFVISKLLKEFTFSVTEEPNGESDVEGKSEKDRHGA